MATQTATELQTFEPAAAVPYVAAPPPSRKSYHGPPPAAATAEASASSPTAFAAAGPAAAAAAAAADGTTTTTAETAAKVISQPRAIILIAQLMGVSLLSSFCGGVVVVALPAIAVSLQLPDGLLLWPTSVFYLTAGSCLLMAGSVADVAGTKRVNLAGALLGAASALACGLARTGAQLIAFRALQGVANAIVFPSSISIISRGVEAGRPRNMGFACLGFAAPIGFSLGLVLGGVFVDHVGRGGAAAAAAGGGDGWRAAFYLAGAVSFALFGVGIWALPPDGDDARASRRAAGQQQSVWKRLVSEIDWVGAVLASTGLATLSYVFATLSADINNIRLASNIVLLVISAVSVPAFIGWMHYQVKHNRIALIPNSLWRSSVFTSSCIMVIFATAVCNCMELFSSLFFQEVQGHSATQASLQILPSLIAGALTNLSTGVFVNRMPVMWTVLISSGLSAIAPLLMALVQPEWLYWYDSFFAQIFAPLSCDILFTVGLLVVSDVFPMHMQALGGAVFNTCAQLGTAIGLTVTSVIAASRTDASGYADKASPSAIMVGYRAVFWTMFAWMMLVCLVCVLGLRRVGGIGVKRD